MNAGLAVIAGVLVIISSVIIVLFCSYYGVFKLPRFASVLIIINACLPVIMVAGLLPLDVSLCLFGSVDTEAKALKVIFDVLYWVSFVLTWVIVPVIVSWLRYSHTVSIKHRIRLIIRENIIFYGIIVAVIIIGLIIMFSTNKSFTFNDILPLGISLANAYGLLVMCFVDGYSFVEMPRGIWRFSNARYKYLYNLLRITKETEVCARAVDDASTEDMLFQNIRDRVRGEISQKFETLGLPRQRSLNLECSNMPIPKEFFVSTVTNKKLNKMLKLEWADCKESQLEDFFSIVDDTTTCMKEGFASLQYAGKKARDALDQYIAMKNGKGKIKPILMKILSIFVALLMVVCLWSEICLIFNNKLSLFYIISHIKMSPIIAELLITAPIIAYLVFVGSWGLTHLRLGSFYRFIPKGTNANTLNYFAILMARLGPTIGFHYLTQIGAKGSKLVEVMGKMEKVVFIGDKWNIFSPILMLVVVVVVLFEVIPRICSAASCRNHIDYDVKTMDPKDLKQGEAILKNLNPEVEDLLDANNLRIYKILDEAQKADSSSDDIRRTLNSNAEDV